MTILQELIELGNLWLGQPNYKPRTRPHNLNLPRKVLTCSYYRAALVNTPRQRLPNHLPLQVAFSFFTLSQTST